MLVVACLWFLLLLLLLLDALHHSITVFCCAWDLLDASSSQFAHFSSQVAQPARRRLSHGMISNQPKVEHRLPIDYNRILKGPGVVIPLIFPKVPRSSQTDPLGFHSYPLILDHLRSGILYLRKTYQQKKLNTRSGRWL